jgi:hypothetical protein
MNKPIHQQLEAAMRCGSDLSPEDRAFVLSAFVHRFTKEHRPNWATSPRTGGDAYPVQFASDADWLANTRFAVNLDGTLNRRFTYCHSAPTWPDNPELRKASSSD